MRRERNRHALRGRGRVRGQNSTTIGAVVVTLAMFTSACSHDGRRARDTASIVAGSAADQASTMASQLKGPAAAASNVMTARLQDARSDLPAAARSLADNARCVGDSTVSVLGVDLVDDFRAADGVVESVELTENTVDELRDAVSSCVDVEKILIATMTNAGISQTKAQCVAERAVNDDELAGPFLVSLVFGDPGLIAATAIAIRAGAPCLNDQDLDLLLPLR